MMRRAWWLAALAAAILASPGAAQGTHPELRRLLAGEWSGSSFRPENGQVSPLRIVFVVTDTSVLGEVYYNNRDFGPIDPGAILTDSSITFTEGPDATFTGILRDGKLVVSATAIGQHLSGTLSKVARPAPGQGRHEIVRGRVTSDSGRAISGAAVLVTRASDRRFKSTATDSAGRYLVDWPDGTGSYTVRITHPGWQTFQTQVSRNGESADSVFDVDAVLGRGGAIELAPIISQAPAPRPPRAQTGFGNETGAVDNQTVPGNAGRRLDPTTAGDLAALLAFALPAALPTAGGTSVLGLSPGQNGTQLNGLAFGGGAIPRTARVAVRASTTSYDPANGWFSGARTNVQLASAGASLFSDLDLHAAIDARALQASDPVATGSGQRYDNVDISVGGDGRILDDQFGINFSAQGSRRSADVTSMLTADPLVWQHAGVASDSVQRLVQLAGNAGIPITAGGVPSATLTDNVVMLGRIDHAPYDWNTLTPASTTWGLLWYGSWNRQQALGLNALATPGHGGETTRGIGALQGEYSFYFGNGYLGDLKSGFTYTHTSTDPYLAIPDASVRVLSTLPDNSTGLSSLQFGGNAGLHSDQRLWTWESVAELQFYPSGNVAHRVKLTADLRRDGSRADALGNTLGSYSFNSLADVAANQPASFTRTVTAPTRYAGAWNGFVALGDLWRVSPAVQVLYGARVEGNVFTNVPAANPAIASFFGAATDHAPNTLHVSPRAGITLNVPGANNRPLGSIRAGVGEFRNLLDPGLLANASVSTGLPGGATRLTCIGTAVPAPDWAAFAADPASIPTQCANGQVALADAAPNVAAFDPSYTAERSWRGNVAWTSNFFGSAYSITGVYSLNLNQHGTRDLNFSDQPQFTLPDEGRPIFATASGIVPGTGVVSAVDARRSPTFGRVVSGVSDLESRSAQVTLSVRPAIRLGNRIGDPIFSYTLSSVRAQQRGFDAATFGSPVVAEWARGDLDARHQFQVQTVLRPMGNFNLLIFLYGRVQSGLPFTPMVGTDVNGDGLANDRAFIFDPATRGDLAALIAGAPDGVRECLLRQVGHAAERNSCEGPWTAQVNASVRIQPVVSHPEFDLTINFSNPLSGIDQLLHGSGNLQGWGGSAAPNPTLYTVQGFDPATQRFAYQVNPRFGDTRPVNTTFRNPFRVTLDASIDLGRAVPAQQLDRWIKPGRAGHPGPKLTAAQLKQRFQRSVPDPYSELLQQADSLLLSADQQAAIQRVDSAYRMQMDSVWTQLGAYLAALPDDVNSGSAYESTDTVIDDAWELTRLGVQRELAAILTPQQLVELGGWAGQFWRAPSRMHQRIFQMVM